ncbi:HAD hydrolase-like protein [Nonomuraea wenchangensis]
MVRREVQACEAAKTVLIGDSDFDMQAARNAGTRRIAYANEPGKADSLTHAGADAVTVRGESTAYEVIRTRPVGGRLGGRHLDV